MPAPGPTKARERLVSIAAERKALLTQREVFRKGMRRITWRLANLEDQERRMRAILARQTP